jgi:hypothetical protein
MYAFLLYYLFLIYLFIRECKLDNKRYSEQDRLADEHIMREIESLKNKKA